MLMEFYIRIEFIKIKCIYYILVKLLIKLLFIKHKRIKYMKEEKIY